MLSKLLIVVVLVKALLICKTIMIILLLVLVLAVAYMCTPTIICVQISVGNGQYMYCDVHNHVYLPAHLLHVQLIVPWPNTN